MRKISQIDSVSIGTQRATNEPLSSPSTFNFIGNPPLKGKHNGKNVTLCRSLDTTVW